MPDSSDPPTTLRARWRTLPRNPLRLARAIVVTGNRAPLTLETLAARTAHYPILAIDDDEMLVELNRLIWERSGATVRTALGGREGIAICQRESLSLILSGFMMPDITGLDVLRFVRSYPPTQAIPFGLLTASPLSVAEDAQANGATGFMQKPFDPRAYLAWGLAMVNAPDEWHGPSLAEMDAVRESQARSRAMFRSG